MRRPRYIRPYGPDALLVDWEPVIDEAVSAGVHAYARAISVHPAVHEVVPAYASLLIRFDHKQTSAYALRELLYQIDPTADTSAAGRAHELPVLYDGPDLEVVAERCGRPPAEIIVLHTQVEYLVYQIGYRPGFGFLGRTEAGLDVARRPEPRERVPAGSVGLAGRQTGVYPVESPGGWQLIGRCPLKMLHPATNEPRLRAGDRVRFTAVDETTYDRLLQTPPPWPKR